MPPLVLLIKFILLLIIFQVRFYTFNLWVVNSTFDRILVANYFFHSPWRPKWSQLGVLFKTLVWNHTFVTVELLNVNSIQMYNISLF